MLVSDSDSSARLKERATSLLRVTLRLHVVAKLTFLGALSSSAGYHLLALSEGAGTSRVDLPNFLVVGLADIVILGLVACRDGRELWGGNAKTSVVLMLARDDGFRCEGPLASLWEGNCEPSGANHLRRLELAAISRTSVCGTWG